MIHKTVFSLNFSIENIAIAAGQFFEFAKSYRVWAFIGGLGAGKTTFAHAICDYVKIEDEVSSPTFAIVNHYQLVTPINDIETIYHSDWYRLHDEEDAINAGIEDLFFNKKAINIVEWYERAPNLIPQGSLMVTFNLEDNGSRTLICWHS